MMTSGAGQINFFVGEDRLSKKVEHMQNTGLAKCVAAVFWADEKVLPEEWTEAQNLFSKNSLDWEQGKALIEEELEALIDQGDDEDDLEETEEEINFGVIDLGPDLDLFEVLCGLAEIACSDKELTWQEIDILHHIGRSMNVNERMVSAALVLATAQNAVTVKLAED
jgi:uncharacterized tellurite resistance protein B-like protein